MATKKSRPVSSRDVFLHLLVIIALYFSAVSIITLLFQIINVYIPAPEYHAYPPSVLGPMRFAIASLFIVFPGFIGLSWYLSHLYDTDASVRDLRLRKVLIHFTLFIAAIIIAGNFISIIYHYLDGDFTSRFLFKSLTVLVVAGTLFGYYIWDARSDHNPRVAKRFAIPTIIVVGAAIVVGGLLIGTPGQQRLQKFDEKRVSDLQQIEYAVSDHLRQNTALPAALSDVKYMTMPTDPETGAAYTYTPTGEKTFELCAVFDTSSKDQEGWRRSLVPYDTTQWAHDAGLQCFQRTVDTTGFVPGGEPLPVKTL